MEGRVVGTDLGLGRFQFAFDLEEDIVEVLKMEPFHFDSWMVSLVRWKPVLEPNYPSKITFWVRVLELPLQFRAAETLQSVGQAIGTVQGPMDLIGGRIRVEVDGFKPLVFSVTVDFEEGVEVTVALRYEKLFGFCRECYMLTHEQSRCPPLAKEDIESFMVGGFDGDGAGATSYKAVVANDTKQLGERREAHYNHSQAGRGGDKDKGIVRESQGAYRQEGSFHPYKGKHPRGYGDGASYQGRYTGYGDRRIGMQCEMMKGINFYRTQISSCLMPLKALGGLLWRVLSTRWDQMALEHLPPRFGRHCCLKNQLQLFR